MKKLKYMVVRRRVVFDIEQVERWAKVYNLPLRKAAQDLIDYIIDAGSEQAEAAVTERENAIEEGWKPIRHIGLKE